MEKEQKRKLMIKVVVQIIFLTAPATILTGYAIYKFREILLSWKGYEVGDFTYSMILFFSMWSAMMLTSKNIFKAMFLVKEDEEKRL